MNTVEKLLKPSSVFAFMLYGAFSYLAIIGKIAPDDVVKIIWGLMGFYFGSKLNKGGTNAETKSYVVDKHGSVSYGEGKPSVNA